MLISNRMHSSDFLYFGYSGFEVVFIFREKTRVRDSKSYDLIKKSYQRDYEDNETILKSATG